MIYQIVIVSNNESLFELYHTIIETMLKTRQKKKSENIEHTKILSRDIR